MGWLRERYRVHFDRGIFAHHGYLAGDDDRRAAELSEALEEPGLAAIFCARGGYGASRYAHRMPWEALRRHPKWLVGFSDVTALHLEANRVGVASLHACNVTALGRSDAPTRDGLRAVLEEPDLPRVWAGTPCQDGDVSGPLWGGNLALVHACAAAGRLALPRGAVLLLEDVGERPYRLDRMVTTLVVGGHLDAIAGVVVGELTACAPGSDGVRPLEALVDVLAPLGVPILGDVPVGHGRRNEPVVLGGPVQLRVGGGEGSLSLGRAADFEGASG